MILDDETLDKIVGPIKADPKTAVVLPAWAYGAGGRCVVLVAGLPVDLHRHLHNLLIRPLNHDERMLQRGPKGNVNPHLFEVRRGRKDRRNPDAAPANRDKVKCVEGHWYSKENTYVTPTGQRKCIKCKRRHNREYMQRKRAEGAREQQASPG